MNTIPDTSPAHILIVDDNPEFLAGLQLTLEMEHYIVDTAVDGQDALKKLENLQAVQQLPDIILTDIMMPIMDGYAFYEAVRANLYTNHIPVIFLTAKTSEDDIQYGKELGSEDYLTKLASTDEILASIRGKLNRIQRRKKLLQQATTEQADIPTKPSSTRWNLIILIIIFILLLLAFGWGLAVITGVL